MALALAESLAARRGLDPGDLMDRFVSWWKAGEFACTGQCDDIGMTTQDALARYLVTGEPFAGADGPGTAGNGSLMRLAPVVLHALQDAAAVRQLAATQSRTTHAAPEAAEACSFFADLLREAILGAPGATVLAPREWPGEAAIDGAARGRWRGRPRAEVQASGYVVHTLEAALWAVDSTDSFEAALVLAVNLGGDADKVGAVTGQLAGALYGMAGIPPRWLARLAWRDRLLAAADALLLPRPSGQAATR